MVVTENPQNKLFGKIGLKLLLPYLVASGFSLLLLVGILYYSYQIQLSSIQKIQESIGQKTAEEVQMYLKQTMQDLLLLSKNISCVGCSDKNSMLIKNLVAQNPSLNVVSIVDAKGDERSMIHRYDSGTMSMKLGNIADEDRFKKVFVEDTYISAIGISEFNLPYVYMSVPIKDTLDKKIGAVVSEVDLSYLWEIAARAQVKKTGYVYIIDQKGNLVAYRDIGIVKSKPNLSNVVGVANFLSNKKGFTQYTSFTKETVMGNWTPIDMVGWGLIVELPTKEIFSENAIVFIISIISLLLSLFFIWFMVRVIYRNLSLPLGKIYRGIQKIRDGDLNVRLETEVVQSDQLDEIGQIAETVNNMTVRLQDSYSSLENKVKERTMALDKEVKDGQKSQIAILSLLEDISVEKKTSEEQAEELRKFKLVIESTSQHIVITDNDGVVIYANPAAEEITGYSRQEIIGSKPSLWGKQMSSEFYTQMWHTIKEEKKTFTGEIVNRRKNGELYTVASIISPVMEDSGEIKFFVGLETDISKQKALEQEIIKEKENVEQKVIERTKELHEEQARLLSSINSLSFGFAVVGMDHRIFLKNKAMADLFHLKETDEITIEQISKFFEGHFDVKLEAEKCLSGKTVCEIKEIIFGRKILRGIIAPIVVNREKEETIGYVLLLEDVTEAKVLERSRDEFFSIASHELRTPLTAIRGNSQMLRDDYKDSMADKDMAEMIDDIHESSMRLIDVVNDFLEVSRLEQGRIELKKEQFDAALVIEKVVKTFNEIAVQKNLSLTYAHQEGVPTSVYSDKAKVEQILVNFLGNSLKFTSKGGITVTVESIPNFLKISITDTGIGVSEQNQSLLFRKFQQAGEQVLARDVTKGTGMGLYICHLLASKLGGSVGLEKSALGEGSTFAFTLPIAP